MISNPYAKIFVKAHFIFWRKFKAVRQEADADGSGSVDFGEFVEMMIKVFGITLDQMGTEKTVEVAEIWQEAK